jgi:F-type H+-transporting ATPase subunit delta
MPLTEAPPDALARVYADSLFQLAEKAGGQNEIESVLGELEDILEIARSDTRFSEFLSSQILPVEARGEALKRILSGRASLLAMNFLLVLNAKGRLGHLAPIVAALDQRVQEAFGRVEVDLYTASPISGDELGAIRDRLREKLRREPIVHPYVDADMIGGLKLQIGDQLIDASVAARLAKLRDRLAREGSAQIRARAERLYDESGASSPGSA